MLEAEVVGPVNPPSDEDQAFFTGMLSSLVEISFPMARVLILDDEEGIHQAAFDVVMTSGKRLRVSVDVVES